VALVVVIGHFFAPFLLLLWRKIKRDIKLLAMVALFILVMRSVDLFWIVKPMFVQREITIPALAQHDDKAKGHEAAQPANRPAHEGTAPGATQPASTPAEPPHATPAPGGAEPAQEHGGGGSGGDHNVPTHGKPTDGHADVATYKSEYQVEVPSLWKSGIHIWDIPAFAGIGGLWVAAFIWRLKQRPLLPPNDPRLANVLHGGHH
jgi:hypothetical protein